MATDEQSQQLFAAIQAYPGEPGQAIEQLRPRADAGDDRAIALIAYFMLQQGQIDEALPYASKAIDLGYAELAQIFATDLAQRQRPELRSRTSEFATAALDAGRPLDVFNLIVNSAQQGPPDIAAQLLESAKGPRPLAQRQQWEELLTQVETEKAQITNAAAEVTGQRDQAFTEINEGVEAVKDRRQAAERQADELGIVTSAIAAENLADAYAGDAKRTEDQAKVFTRASLAVGAISVIASMVGLILVKEGSSFETVIAHAAFGLPFALLAAYVNNLASAHRQEAWRLRHIELQIRTANPFLGLLDSERRKETLATLALRFFPGQEGIGTNSKESAELPLNLIEAVGKLLREQQPTTAGTPPVVTPPPEQP